MPPTGPNAGPRRLLSFKSRNDSLQPPTYPSLVVPFDGNICEQWLNRVTNLATKTPVVAIQPNIANRLFLAKLVQ